MEQMQGQYLEKLRSVSTALKRPESTQNRKIRLSSDEIKALFDEPCFDDLNLQNLKNSHLLSLEKFQILYQGFNNWNKYRTKKGTEWSSKQMGYFLNKIFGKVQEINNLPFEKAAVELQKLFSDLNIRVVLKKAESVYKMPRLKDCVSTSTFERRFLERYQMRETQDHKDSTKKKSLSEFGSIQGQGKRSIFEGVSNLERQRSESIFKEEIIRQMNNNKIRMAKRRANNLQFLDRNPLKIPSAMGKYKINTVSEQVIERLVKQNTEQSPTSKKQYLSDPTKLGLINLKSILSRKRSRVCKPQKSKKKKKEKS